MFANVRGTKYPSTKELSRKTANRLIPSVGTEVHRSAPKCTEMHRNAPRGHKSAQYRISQQSSHIYGSKLDSESLLRPVFRLSDDHRRRPLGRALTETPGPGPPADPEDSSGEYHARQKDRPRDVVESCPRGRRWRRWVGVGTVAIRHLSCRDRGRRRDLEPT